MTMHVPNKGEQMVRYYDHYSNTSRGLRQKKNFVDLIPSILEPENLKPDRTGSRLIQKIYEVDPCCPKCQGRMRFISVPIGDGGNPSPSGEARICDMIG